MCKYILSLLIVAAAMMLVAPGAQAGVYIELIDTLTDIEMDYIPTNTPVAIRVMMDNDAGEYVDGIVHAVRIYSLNGAGWQPPTYTVGDSLGEYFDLVAAVTGFNVDGVSDDTIGVAGAVIGSPGVPDGYEGLELFRINTQVSDTYRGDTLCIDSSFHPQGGIWAWATPSGQVTPSWGGPYCFAIVQHASISGTKFHDENGNSVWDAGESTIDNVTINLHGALDAGGTIDLSTVTDAQGDYLFSGLTPGDYWVVEEVESWWAAQTYPLTVFHTVPDVQWGDNLTGLNFGNDTLCEQSSTYTTCLNGTEDNFVGAEPSNVSPSLLAWLQTQYDYITDFDQPANNQAFGHTFEGCWDDQCVVVGATLRIKLRGSASGTSTDFLILGDYDQPNNGRIWSITISDLDAHFGGDGVWNVGEVAEFTLDLANLPYRNWLPTNILAALQDGTLDIVVSDDTEVDFIEIEVELCCPDTCYAYGDANGDGIALAVADLVFLTEFINNCGPAPNPLYSCDLTGDGYVNQADIDLFNDYFVYGMSVFTNGYPVPVPCDPIAEVVPDTVNIFGMEHVSMGTACLEMADDTLKVTRLGSSGTDGLVIDPGENASGWNMLISNPDFDNSMPEGASMSITTTATVDGVPDLFIDEMSQTKVGDAWELSLTTDAPSLTIEAYLGDSLVYLWEDYVGGSRTDKVAVGIAFLGPGHGPMGFDTIWANDFHQETRWYSGGGGMNAGYVIVSIWTFNGEPVKYEFEGHSVHVDRIRITPAHIWSEVESPTLGDVSIRTDGIPSLTILSESYAVDYDGIIVSNLGNAIVTRVDTTLVVSNCGPSGDDGIDAEADKMDGDWAMVECIIANPDADGTLPIGASIRAGYAWPLPQDSSDWFSSMTKAAPNTWGLGVEGGAGPYTVTGYNDEVEVFTAEVVSASDLGQIVETAKGVYPVGFSGSANGKPSTIVAISTDYDFTASPSGVQWSWSAEGVSNLTVDYISVSSDMTGEGVNIGSVAILANNGGAKGDPISFTVLDIKFSDPDGSCCVLRGDINHDGGIDISDLVYLVDYMFTGGPPPPCMEEADINGDGGVDIADLVHLVDYMFTGGPAPVTCGPVVKAGKAITQSSDIYFDVEYANGVSTVVMNSSIDLRGIQLELKGIGSDPVNLVGEHVDMVHGSDGSVLKIGLLDLDGGEVVRSDVTRIIRLEGKYSLESVTVADLAARSITPTIGTVQKPGELPADYALSQNYPNPFNPSTSIAFALPEASEVRLTVYNLLGRRVSTVVNRAMEAGHHTAEWKGQNDNGQAVSSGVYFYRLETPRFAQSKKMVLLK